MRKTEIKTLLSMAAFILFLCGVFSLPVLAEEEVEEKILPPLSLIEGNEKETDVTVAVEIADIREEQIIRSDDGRPGYLVFRIGAEVFRCYRGEIGKEIVYRRLLEAGIKPPEKGTRHIVSLKMKDGRLVVPDVAYHFEYSEGLHMLFEKAVGEIGCRHTPNEGP